MSIPQSAAIASVETTSRIRTTLESLESGVTDTSPLTLPAKLLRHAAARPDDVAIRHKDLGVWREYTWLDYAERVVAAGSGLAALGVKAGDRVAIHSENRPEWCFADFGAQAIGAVPVGVYPTSPAAEVEYLLGHSETTVLIAEDEEQLDKAMEVWDGLDALTAIVVIETRGVRVLDDPRIYTFDQLLDLGREHDGTEVLASVSGLDPDNPALIVYTSGTTGPPKGAMITHRAVDAAATSYVSVIGLDDRDELLSYLPLCHAAERVITVGTGTAVGFIVNFGEGAEALNNDMRDVQPTFFLGVPRIWEKMLARVDVAMTDATWLKRTVFDFWLKRGKSVAARRMKGTMTVLDRAMFFVGNAMIYRPLRERLGLQRAEKSMSGAAPIAPQVLEFFWSIGVPVREAYAQTESTVATMVPLEDVRLGSVGVPVVGAEVRIADDGEIMVRSAANFAGYLKDSEKTAETITTDGWIHTGDIGTIDEDGFLYITDRKKDIIITAGGKNISPSEIENALKVSPFVREAIVIGDRRKFLTALVGIELDTVGDWATRNRVSYTTYGDLSGQPEVVALIDDVVQKVNVDLAQVETIKKFRLLDVELDHEDGQLTATQKVKRSAIADQFGQMIEEMYR